MKHTVIMDADYHQMEPLGTLPDPDMNRYGDALFEERDEFMNETSITRRIIRSHSIPSNVDDSSALIAMTLMAQRRGNGAAKRGEAWADVGDFVMSKLHANEHAKLELGPNQTKSVFLHLGRRYKETQKLQEILKGIDVVTIDAGDTDSTTVETVTRLVAEFGNTDQAHILIEVLNEAKGNLGMLHQLIELAKSQPDTAKVAAASLNLARYSDAIEQLEALIEDNVPEQSFQQLLEANPWMFGGEYSERLERRDWIRDQQTDFMMRRTVDSYLEIVEIKTTLNGAPLFRKDSSHDSWYPQAKLSQVVGQVIGYIDQIDAKRNDIFFDDGERVNKIRSKIIIGRNTDQEQIDALRRFNSHLHRIEVFTFDQLLNTAKRVRDHLETVLDPVLTQNEEDDMGDVPF